MAEEGSLMSAEQKTGSSNGGQRWYDANRMVVALGSVIMTIVFGLGCFSLGAAINANLANTRQDAEIDAIKKSMDEVKADVKELLRRTPQ